MSGLAAALVSLLILLLMARRDPKRLRASRQSARPMSTAQRRSWAILALLPGVTLAVACGASAVLLWLAVLIIGGWLLALAYSLRDRA